MTPLQWFYVGALVLVVMFGAMVLLQKEPRGIKQDHENRARELSDAAIDYTIKGMPRNAAACRRSADQEHEKAMGREGRDDD